jgi:hypothetical protein
VALFGRQTPFWIGGSCEDSWLVRGPPPPPGPGGIPRKPAAPIIPPPFAKLLAAPLTPTGAVSIAIGARPPPSWLTSALVERRIKFPPLPPIIFSSIPRPIPPITIPSNAGLITGVCELLEPRGEDVLLACPWMLMNLDAP